MSIIRSSGVRLIAEIRANPNEISGSLREEGGFEETCEKGEGGTASGEDLLSETQKEERERERAAGTISWRFFNARLIHLGPRLRHLLLPVLSFSPSASSFSCSSSFYLEARKARTTCLLEKSAPLPRALINLHSAKSEEQGVRRGRNRIPRQVPTRVTPINVADRMQSCSSY